MDAVNPSLPESRKRLLKQLANVYLGKELDVQFQSADNIDAFWTAEQIVSTESTPVSEGLFISL